MKGIFTPIKVLIRLMYWISCIALVSVVFLTVSDIILRRLKKPIEFTYEVVLLLGAIVMGFSIPQTSLAKGHVIMDFLITELPQGWKKIFYLVTRCLGISIFSIIGWNLITLGNHLYRVGQVSPILKIPEYPVVYGVGICCLVECLVLLYDLFMTLKGMTS